jgi:hypothetical protein
MVTKGDMAGSQLTLGGRAICTVPPQMRVFWKGTGVDGQVAEFRRNLEHEARVRLQQMVVLTKSRCVTAIIRRQHRLVYLQS